LQALLDEDIHTNVEIGRNIKCYPSRRFLSSKSIGKDPERRKLDALSIKGKRHRKTICEILLQRHKEKQFLYRIITGDEKWIYFDNPKRKKSWIDPGQPSVSQAVRTIHGNKALLCIWWDQKEAIYYELLKPGETVTGGRYRQQLIKLNRALKEKRPEWANRHNKVILLHDNARPYVAKPVQNFLENIGWEILPHVAYSPDLAPSDYHLFRSMQHGLSEQHFNSYEQVKKWIDD